MFRTYCCLITFSFLIFANAWSRGGGGCFLPETPILLTSGTSVAISHVKPGDQVKAYDSNGKLVATTVRAVFKHTVDAYYTLTTDKVMLNVTGEHPFYIGHGAFKTMEQLSVGDVIYGYDGNQLSQQTITSITKRVSTSITVYNLQTDDPHTYFAAGIAVHNKGGGCFPAGTKILTPSGLKMIESLVPGDHVVSISKDGTKHISLIKTTYATRSQILTLVTQNGVLHTTAEHPIAVDANAFMRADHLKIGDTILMFYNGTLVKHSIKSIYTDPAVIVFNIETEAPHTFVADNVVVHNKGGSYHAGGHNSQSSKDDSLSWSGAIVVLFLIIFRIFISSDDSEYLNPREKIEKKTNQTMMLLKSLAEQDIAMLPDNLTQKTRDVFILLQKCWANRDYSPMKEFMMPPIFNLHCQKIQDMIKNHEINILKDLRIDNIDLVNVNYYKDVNRREFTALITATVIDYYVSDRSSIFLRGDSKTAKLFQEFWTFQYQSNGWCLSDIKQSDEGDFLKRKDFVEPFANLN